MSIVDHRPAQSPVRNQGPRGSCVAFAVTAAHDWIASGTARSVEDALWAAHRVGGDPAFEPTSVQYALAGLAQYQHASEAGWPYGAPAFPASRPTPESVLELEALPPWRALPASTTSFVEVAAAVTSGVAVILTLEHIARAWQEAHSSGIVDAPAGRKIVARHAVLVVGASTDPLDSFLIIKNSWGPDWASGGYAQLSKRYFEQYLVDIHTLGS